MMPQSQPGMAIFAPPSYVLHLDECKSVDKERRTPPDPEYTCTEAELKKEEKSRKEK
jgi:hypothetical protein